MTVAERLKENEYEEEYVVFSNLHMMTQQLE